jgi:hypothetical protein
MRIGATRRDAQSVHKNFVTAKRRFWRQHVGVAKGAG